MQVLNHVSSEAIQLIKINTELYVLPNEINSLNELMILSNDDKNNINRIAVTNGIGNLDFNEKNIASFVFSSKENKVEDLSEDMICIQDELGDIYMSLDFLHYLPIDLFIDKREGDEFDLWITSDKYFEGNKVIFFLHVKVNQKACKFTNCTFQEMLYKLLKNRK